jgi:hypothetical protein
MESYKLHIKVGPHEFQGEGPEESVKRDYDEWRTLISIAPSKHSLTGAAIEAPSAGLPMPEVDQQLISKVIISDERRNMVSLRMIPRTDDRDGDALLLILLGHKLLRNEDEVLVTQLKPELTQSGLVVERVDRMANRPVNAGFLNKGGLGKGGRYSLTNAGMEYAKALLNSMARA